MGSTYEEAVGAGLSRREASYVAFAADLKVFVAELRKAQTEFLTEIGVSWEEARALDAEGRAALNERWRDWYEARLHAPVASPI